MRILGIDPGSRCTGYGVIERVRREWHHVAHGHIKPAQGELGDRLSYIAAELRQVIQTYAPTGAAVEQIFTCHNVRSALMLGQARGAILVTLADAGLSVGEYAPRAVKLAIVGSGAAEKTQVQHMVRFLLRLQAPVQADAADALAIAICHAHTQTSYARVAIGS